MLNADFCQVDEGAEPSEAVLRDQRFVIHGWAPANCSPPSELVIVSGTGYLLRDERGREYVDCISGSLNATLGHGHPDVLEAAQRQLEILAHFDLTVGTHHPVGDLAERLASVLPGTLGHTFFANSGSEGVEAALTIALDVGKIRGRNRLVSLAAGYHGCTFLAQHLSGLPSMRSDWGDPVPVTRVPLPLPAAEMRTAGAADLLLSAFAQALDDTVAAVVVEPFLNVGGGIVLPRSFLAGLRDLCDRHGVLLILDEVFCGMGRTGRMFGFEHEQITPDIVVLSKGLSGGYIPLSAVTVTDEVLGMLATEPMFGGLRYGHTTSGHAAACATAAVVLSKLTQTTLLADADRQGSRLLETLAPLVSQEAVVDVRGLGLVAVVEFAHSLLAERVDRMLRDGGVLVRRQGEALMLAPPLVIDTAGVDRVANEVAAAVGALKSRTEPVARIVSRS